jgi:hypothetical protein
MAAAVVRGYGLDFFPPPHAFPTQSLRHEQGASLLIGSTQGKLYALGTGFKNKPSNGVGFDPNQNSAGDGILAVFNVSVQPCSPMTSDFWVNSHPSRNPMLEILGLP